MRRSNSIRVDTASTCLSSRSTRCLAALRMWLGYHVSLERRYQSVEAVTALAYARSMLLKCALLISIEGLPFLAAWRISWPMCSPSRSQSVHTKSARADLACRSMFSAMTFLSWWAVSRELIGWTAATAATHFGHNSVDRGLKQPLGRRELPVFVVWAELELGHMAGDTRHGNFAVSPWRSKVKRKAVVLDVPGPRVVLDGG